MTATATAIVARKNDFVLSGPVGSFDAYMDKVSRIPVLSREDEADLAKRFPMKVISRLPASSCCHICDSSCTSRAATRVMACPSATWCRKATWAS